MRAIRYALMGALLLTTGLANTAATSRAPVRKGPAPLLLPLSERDQLSSHEMGCQLSFDTRQGTLLYMIGHDLMIRTAAGLKVCKISDAQFSAMGEAKGTVACAGSSMSVRRTGKAISHEESDSADGPAILGVARGVSKWTAPGRWGSAC